MNRKTIGMIWIWMAMLLVFIGSVRVAAAAARYDLREHVKISVKNQERDGDCWIFAPVYAMETHLALRGETAAFSVNQIERRHGFARQYDRFNGGRREIIFAYAASEDLYPEVLSPYTPGLSPREVAAIPLLPESAATHRIMGLRELSTAEAVKAFLPEYGAVVTNILHHHDGRKRFPYRDDTYYHPENHAYYYPGPGPANHQVAIIGWDDNYSRDRFVTKPKRDGAWICIDAQGEAFGERGVYYVSYESAEIATGMYGFTEIQNIAGTHSERLQLETAPWSSHMSAWATGDAAGYFLVFDAPSAPIAEIGFGVGEEIEGYTLRYVQDAEKWLRDVKRGKFTDADIARLPVLAQGGRTPAGFRAVPVDCSPKGKFAIFLHLEGGDRPYIGMSPNSDGPQVTGVSIPKEVCWFYDEETDEMVDAALVNAMISIKAYTKGESPAPAEDPIDMPDARLRKLINRTLDPNRPEDAPIYPSEMRSLRTLDASKLDAIDIPGAPHKQGPKYRGIQNLKGMEYATQLETLDLSENGITDYAPLSGLQHLRHLDVNRNFAADATPLFALKNLEYLNLYNNELSSIEGIQALTKLKHLDLHFNAQEEGHRLADIRPLAALVELEYLNIESNGIEDVEVLAHLPKLTNLGIGNNCIVDFRPVREHIQRAWIEQDPERYFGSYAQFLPPLEVTLDADGNAEIANPSKGLEEYAAYLTAQYGVEIPVVEAEPPAQISLTYDVQKGALCIHADALHEDVQLGKVMLNYDQLNLIWPNITVRPQATPDPNPTPDPTPPPDPTPTPVEPDQPIFPAPYPPNPVRPEKPATPAEPEKPALPSTGLRLPKPHAAAGFSDIAADLHRDVILHLSRYDVLRGVDATRFAPGEPVTRAMVAATLRRISEDQTAPQGHNPFVDVPEDAWYRDDILWANASGILLGKDGACADANALVTRQELALILERFARIHGIALSGSRSFDYTDAGSIPKWSEAAIRALDRAGVLTGQSETLYAPASAVTRSELAKALHTLLLAAGVLR